MDAYAVIETGGKQYRVRANDTLRVERLHAAVGETVTIDQVLAASDGSTITIGKPHVAGAAVTSRVVEHVRGDKVIAYKKKRRKGYERKQGHRQDLTVLRVESVA